MDENNNTQAENPISDSNTVNIPNYDVDGKQYDNNNNSTSNTGSNDSGRNGFTTASLVLGILSLMPCCCWNVLGFVFALLAIVFYFLGKNSARNQGKKEATAGLICAIISITVFVCVFVITKFILGRALVAGVELLKVIIEKIDFEGIKESISGDIDINGVVDAIKQRISG